MSEQKSGTVNSANEAWAPSHLRQLLVSLGLGQRGGVSIREVARRSGRRLTREWVRLLLQPIPAGERGTRYSYENIQALAETLQQLGVRVSVRELDRAVMADLGYSQAVSDHIAATEGDRLAEIIELVRDLSDADLRRLQLFLSTLLAPTEFPTARQA